MIMFKRGKKLYLEFFDNVKNKKVQKSTGKDDTEENRKFVKEILIPQLQKKISSERKTTSVSDSRTLKFYTNKYLREKENLSTYYEILSKSNSILKYFGDISVNSIKPLDCKDYIFDLKVSTKTKRNYLNVLRGIFTIACEDLAINENPTRTISLRKTEEERAKVDIEPFSKVNVEKLISESAGVLKDYLGLSFYTGARVGEILALQVSDFDFERKTISFTKQYTQRKLKNSLKTESSNREIPLFDVVLPFLESLVKRANKLGTTYLFSNENNPTKLLSIDNIRGTKKYGVWSKLLKSCDLEYRKIYNTRHTFAVHMLSSGKLSASEVSRILGHTNSQTMFNHYNKYIQGEQLKIERNIDIFRSTDNLTDTDTLVNKNRNLKCA